MFNKINRSNPLIRLFTISLFGLFPFIANAQCVLSNAALTGETAIEAVGQSFTATAGCNGLYVSSVVIYSATSHTEAILRIYQGSGTGGTQLYEQQDIVINGVVNFSISTTINLTSNVQLTNGNSYTFELSFPGGNPSTFQLGKSTLVDAYAGGAVYENGFPVAGQDLTFSINTTSTPLPVELVGFEATSEEGSVLLSWQTASELNNAGFEIERSNDAKNWKPIGWVEGSGNHTAAVDYQFIDGRPINGINYYRLKQIDFDGDYEYSAIKSVDARDAASSLMLYPNPVAAGGTLNLTGPMEGECFVAVIDAQGNLVREAFMEDTNNCKIMLPSNMLPGIYTLVVDTEGRKTTSRFVVRF